MSGEALTRKLGNNHNAELAGSNGLPGLSVHDLHENMSIGYVVDIFFLAFYRPRPG
jgi:hypothetical protein